MAMAKLARRGGGGSRRLELRRGANFDLRPKHQHQVSKLHIPHQRNFFQPSKPRGARMVDCVRWTAATFTIDPPGPAGFQTLAVVTSTLARWGVLWFAKKYLPGHTMDNAGAR